MLPATLGHNDVITHHATHILDLPSNALDCTLQVVEECAERLSDDAVQDLIACISEHLGSAEAGEEGGSGNIQAESEALEEEKEKEEEEEEETREGEENGVGEVEDELVSEDHRQAAIEDDGD